MVIRVIGSSHRLTPPSRLQEAVANREGILASLVRLQAAERIQGAVLLTTCNRIEVVLHFGDGPADSDRDSDHEEQSGLVPDDLFGGVPCHDLHGLAATRYLIRVATGLDSMVRGEDQILGQWREAFKLAEKHGLLSNRLRVLRNQIIPAARDIRQRTGLAKCNVSVAAFAARHLQRAGSRLAVVGAGETGRLALETLTRRSKQSKQKAGQIVVVNRTMQRARSLASHFGVEAMSLLEFLDVSSDENSTDGFDGALLAVRSPRPLFQAQHLRRMKMVVDISMPGVICPTVRRRATAGGVEILDLDAIARLVQIEGERRRSALEVAEDLTRGVSKTVFDALVSSGRGQHLANIVERHVETAERELQTAFETKLRHLSDVDREHVRRTLLRATKRNAHLHVEDLREQTRA